ncbi:hypothetical protein SAMN02745194_04905 [Roseomonas rosea]|uniref:Lipoprotein n=1 Tax=Muricoccus roseus TaxID=198092 RepID=A0A1M6SEG3_9PROT|nr:hypothetical protein [Roseomonas rosea]SHK43174.1 hypothetical protein SAMN02745194_04905 [Roseomonas rosea]
MSRRAALALAALLPLLAACGGRSAPELTVEEAYARLPEEIGGFRKSWPERGAPGTVIARYAHPNRSAASVHALPPARRTEVRDGEEDPEVGAAMETFARGVAVEAASRRENVTLRHFGARAAEAGPAARCLDVYLRGDAPRRQLGCAAMLERRVFVVMMLAPESADLRRGLRDPLLAVTMRLIGALAGGAPEAIPADADDPIPPPPAAAPPAPPAPAAPRRPRLPTVGPTWRT